MNTFGWVAIFAAVTVVVLVAATMYGKWNIGRDDEATKALRSRAMGGGPIEEGAAFQLEGVGKGMAAAIYLEMDFVEHDANLEATLRDTGVMLELEVQAGERVVLSRRTVKVPANHLSHELFRVYGRRNLRIRGTVPVHDLSVIAVGERWIVRGGVEPLPNNTIRALHLWLV